MRVLIISVALAALVSSSYGVGLPEFFNLVPEYCRPKFPLNPKNPPGRGWTCIQGLCYNDWPKNIPKSKIPHGSIPFDPLRDPNNPNNEPGGSNDPNYPDRRPPGYPGGPGDYPPGSPGGPGGPGTFPPGPGKHPGTLLPAECYPDNTGPAKQDDKIDRKYFGLPLNMVRPPGYYAGAGIYNPYGPPTLPYTPIGPLTPVGAVGPIY